MGKENVPLCACGCGEPSEYQIDARCFGEPPRMTYNSGHLFPAPTEPPVLHKGESMEPWNGYVVVRVAPGKTRQAHRLIAERAMGKPLPRKAHVHHVNGCGWDNRPQNLVVCEGQAYHALLHKRQRAMEATGDPSALRCANCGSYARPEHMRTKMYRSGEVVTAHTADASDICPRSHHHGRWEKYHRQSARTRERRQVVNEARANARRVA